MQTFLTTLSQISYLFLLIGAGFAIMKLCKLPAVATNVLSKLVSTLFMPALILTNFMENFTVERISSAWPYALAGIIVVTLSIAFALIVSRFSARDSYRRKIHSYCLAFSNFGFMGTAVVSTLMPELFMSYLILCTPMWVVNYSWAIPALLIPSEKTKGFSFKNLLNPLFIAMIIGIIIGMTRLPIPSFLEVSIDSLSKCMSPSTMLLTGMCVAKIDIKRVLKIKSIYVLSALRLLIIPSIFLLVLLVHKFDYGVSLCALSVLSMPLGLNGVVIPESHGQDTSEASGMAIVSHLASALTIPLMFTLFDLIM
ncbi:MAG: AEC family transporter [Clostridia bacterium]|nr:AEC family transporter [Clostridia bacterium]MBQ8566144.1 AEC family transporter [Clostridia bacterium]